MEKILEYLPNNIFSFSNNDNNNQNIKKMIIKRKILKNKNEKNNLLETIKKDNEDNEDNEDNIIKVLDNSNNVKKIIKNNLLKKNQTNINDDEYIIPFTERGKTIINQNQWGEKSDINNNFNKHQNNENNQIKQNNQREQKQENNKNDDIKKNIKLVIEPKNNIIYGPKLPENNLNNDNIKSKNHIDKKEYQPYRIDKDVNLNNKNTLPLELLNINNNYKNINQPHIIIEKKTFDEPFNKIPLEIQNQIPQLKNNIINKPEKDNNDKTIIQIKKYPLYSEEILDDDFPKIDHIEDIDIVLKDHQRALVRRCLNIEKYYINKDGENYGVMSDLPGAGKTFTVLSLVWFSKLYYENMNIANEERLSSLIVVPQNILTQWVDSIKRYSKRLTYKILTDYNDILLINYSNKILYENDILITTPLFYYNISSLFQNMKYQFNRVYFDEIDSISGLLRTPLKANFLWFISASFNPDSTGEYKIIKSEIPYHTAKCKPEFIHKNFIIPEPIYYEYIIHNDIVEKWLKLLVFSENIIKNVNGLNYVNYFVVKGGSGNSVFNGFSIINAKGNDEKDFINLLRYDNRLILQYYPERIKLLEEQLKNAEKKMALEKENTSLIEMMNEIRKEYNEVRSKLMDAINKIKKISKELENNNSCSKCFKELYQKENLKKYITPCCNESICKDCYNNWTKSKDGNDKCYFCRVNNLYENDYIEREEENKDEVLENMKIRLIEKEERLNQIRLRIKNMNIQRNDINYNQFILKEDSDKLWEFEKWVKIYLNKSKKIIIFSDFLNCFSVVENIITKYGYKCVQLDGGNIDDIDKNLNEYKNGSSNFLLMSSEYFGFGMNLEFTTDVVFLNKIEKAKEKQIIGRAQRPGRTDTLIVHYFYYFNEYLNNN